jgi:eukaryotic-like serine/threonine-protein kinase
MRKSDTLHQFAADGVEAPWPGDDAELRDRLCGDMVARWRRGERVPVEAYLQRQPQPAGDELAFELVLTEVVLRQEYGEPAPLEEFVWRFPYFTDRLCRHFALHATLAFFPSPNFPASASLPPVARPSPQGLPEVPGYELLEQLGAGAMGVVYKARQVRLNRLVALKMVLAGHAGEAERARFRTEAEALGRLQHPHIVQIHDIGAHDGRPFLVCELVEGGSLADHLRGGPLAPPVAAALIEALAGAMHYAHERDIVHRDLKPANILLADEAPRLTGSTRRLEHPTHLPGKITDFGLAKLLDHTAGHTQVGDVVGTPAYMAPEQAAGRLQTVGAPADVYALGAVLYEALTARPPFVADSPLATLAQVVEAEPLPPSRLRPGLSRDLETVCLKCLHKEPARRYASALALAEDLARWRKGEPILARPVSRGERAWRWCRRNPVLAALTTAVATLLLVLAVGGSSSSLYLHATLQKAESNRKQAVQAEGEKADRLRESYLAQARAGRLSTRPGRRFDSLQALREAARIRPGLDLRNEAIACMVLPDLKVTRQWPGHPPGTAGLVFDPALERYARSDQQGNISLRRTADDQELTRLPGPGKPAWLLRFSPDGQFLAARYDSGTTTVWDLTRDRAAAPVAPGRVFAFTPDGGQLASLEGRTIVFFDLESGKVVKRLETKGTKGPSQIVFDPTGGRLAFATEEGPDAVQIYDVPGDCLLATLPHPKGVRAVAWRPDGQFLAAACDDCHIHVWDVDRQGTVVVLEGHEAEPTEVAFHPGGDLLVSTGWDGTIRLWDPLARKLLVTEVAGCGIGFPKYQFSPDGRRLGFAWDGGSQLGLWEVAPGEGCHALRAHDAADQRVWNADVSADGRLVASAHDDGVRLWDIGSRRQVAHWDQGRRAQTAKFLPGGEEGRAGAPGALLVYNEAGLQRVPLTHSPGGTLSLGPSQILLQVPPTETAALSAGLDHDGRWIAAADRKHDRVIVLDEWAPGEKTFLTDHRHINKLVLSPDGRWVASITWGTRSSRVVRVADVRRHRVVEKWEGDYALGAFSPDGRWLVTGGEECRFWEVGSWRLAKTLLPDPALGKIVRAAFRPDGKVLALAYSSRALLLVDPESGEELARLTAPYPLHLFSLSFSPDGNWLAVGCANHTVQVWDLESVWTQLTEMGLGL